MLDKPLTSYNTHELEDYFHECSPVELVTHHMTEMINAINNGVSDPEIKINSIQNAQVSTGISVPMFMSIKRELESVRPEEEK